MPNVVSSTGLRWLWISVLALVLDQVTKLWVIAEFRLYESVAVMPYFNLTYVHNYGAAFSFLADAGGWQRWFFTIIASVVSCLVVWWLYKAKRDQVLFSVALAFILGGAVGNLYDRLAYGYVIDFLDFYVGNWHWPAFNIADSSIFLGAACLIWDSFKNPEPESTEAEEKL